MPDILAILLLIMIVGVCLLLIALLFDADALFNFSMFLVIGPAILVMLAFAGSLIGQLIS